MIRIYTASRLIENTIRINRSISENTLLHVSEAFAAAMQYSTVCSRDTLGNKTLGSKGHAHPNQVEMIHTNQIRTVGKGKRDLSKVSYRS